ncbi:MAG: hypothetical protein JWL73_3102 [Actinomycetia bacterium]|nr:hypothetical protein [Actinomycetes bacterium]
MTVTVLLKRVRSDVVHEFAEIDIDNVDSDDWIAHPLVGSEQQVHLFYPGTVRVRIVDGPLIGRATTAVIYHRAYGSILMGEAAFV